MALYELLSGGWIIASLLTTVTKDYDRVSMHGVRRDLLRAQACSLELELDEVEIPKDASNEVYEAQMGKALRKYLAMGIKNVAFGDIFLQDVRDYRENNLAKFGMMGLFPLWGRDTTELARKFVSLGFKAVICCVDLQRAPAELIGREYDEAIIEGLPVGVDPCGENGEFHTFVYDGPVFRRRIEFRRGEVVLRDGRFLYQDLRPV